MGTQDGSTVVPVFDWISFFSACSKKVPQMKKLHQFVFDETCPGEERSVIECNILTSSALQFPEYRQFLYFIQVLSFSLGYRSCIYQDIAQL